VNRRELIIITQTWPGYQNGSRQALLASLRLYLKCVDSVHYIAMTDDIRSEVPEGLEGVEFHQIPLNKLSHSKRFLCSLLSLTPAVSHQFTRRHVLRALRERVSEICQRGSQVIVLVEHLAPVAAWLRIQSDFSTVKFGLRSHDVLTSAFRELANRSPVGVKQLLAWEVFRIRNLEHRAFQGADFAWAITAENVAEYQSEYGLSCNGVIGVEIDFERFQSVQEGDPWTVLHLGGHDLRKMQGLRSLIRNVWPIVREKFPTAKLLLGGKGSEQLDAPELGIVGLGFVDDECGYLSQGALFVNPQESGSGIKLKSLNALAAGKTLISKMNGIEGVGGRNHVDYWAADSDQEMADYMIRLMQDESLRRQTSLNGLTHVKEYFSREAIELNSLSLVKEAFEEEIV